MLSDLQSPLFFNSAGSTIKGPYGIGGSGTAFKRDMAIQIPRSYNPNTGEGISVYPTSSSLEFIKVRANSSKFYINDSVSEFEEVDSTTVNLTSSKNPRYSALVEDDTYYYYPSVEEQLQDEQSILNYYKMAMRLRNAFPSIARGKVTNYSDNYSSYVCVVTKEYAGELITIVINLDSFEQNISLDQSALNVTNIAGELYATNEGKATLNGTNLVIPPYAIVILK